MTQSHTPVLDALLLAAGRGARFGGDKLLADLNGAPLATWALRTALAAPVGRVFVAIGDDPRLVAALQDGADRLGATGRLVLVPSPNAMDGMGASLAAAAAALPDDTRGAFVFLGDMPSIAPETPARLAAALDEPDRIISPIHGGRRGHPVLFGAAWRSALAGSRGDEGARALLDQAGPRLVAVDVDDPGIHLDVDRPEDLGRLATAIGANARDR